MGFFIYINIFISMGNNTVKRLLKESLNLEYFIKELDSRLDFSSFKMNDDLQPDIWDSEGNMKDDIRTNLIKIADNYWKSLDLGFEYEDITLTGSLANYNWSKYSDVDLHIILDINKLGDNKEMVKDLLDVKTRKWNSDHDITIKGFEVELYLQPHDIKHFATGVYSVMNDEWNIEPKKEVVSLDKETIRKKYKDIVKSVEEIEKDKDNENVINRVDKLKEKVKAMRLAGLEGDGEYSVENIVFKLLRRNDIMEKLGDLSTDAYDDEYTIDEDMGQENLSTIKTKIPFNKLVLDKVNLEWAIENVKSGNLSRSSNKPLQVALSSDGKLYLLDGYHRLTQLVLNGKTNANGIMINKSYEQLKTKDMLGLGCIGGRGDKYCNNFKTIGDINDINDEDLLEEGQMANWLAAGAITLGSLLPNSSMAQEYKKGGDDVKTKIIQTIKTASEKGNEKANVIWDNIQKQMDIKKLKNSGYKKDNPMTSNQLYQQAESKGKEVKKTEEIKTSSNFNVRQRHINDILSKLGGNKAGRNMTFFNPSTNMMVIYYF